MDTKEQLPIETWKGEIMACDAPYVIVEAETGSGKTTIVPQWFAERGLSVLVTEPLVETVIGTAMHVADIMGCRIGTTVGYHTAMQKSYSRNTRILFCTDGLALVRELAGSGQFDVLILDELHVWNTNQETLEAWAWMHLTRGNGSFRFKKVIALSATMDTAALAAARGNAPCFRVPGRQFPITDRAPGKSIVDDVMVLIQEGRDVFVFQPGKNEIKKTLHALSGMNAELIPFYSDLIREEKDRAYRSYSRPKVIVSTNALETGRTLLPSTGRTLAVVDSGMERRIELSPEGIEVLNLAPIAQSTSTQRRGRTGRTGSGIAIDHCHVPFEKRPLYPVPEVLRTRIDQMVLRLAVAGYDATHLPFFHPIDPKSVVEARRLLVALGAVAEDGATVTKIGELMAKLPISSRYARMIVEAQPSHVLADVLTIAAVLEVGGIRATENDAWREYTDESTSDLLAEWELWNLADGASDQELQEMGLTPTAFRRSEKIRLKLFNVLITAKVDVEVEGSGDRTAILRACVAGMADHVFRRTKGRRTYRGSDGMVRHLTSQSVVGGKSEYIVGFPFDIVTRTGESPILHHAITMASAVNPSWFGDSSLNVC